MSTEHVPKPLQAWQEDGRKGIWLKVPITKVGLIEPAVKQGFTFHHAEPEYVQLARWLPSTPSKLPANASHQVDLTLVASCAACMRCGFCTALSRVVCVLLRIASALSMHLAWCGDCSADVGADSVQRGAHVSRWESAALC